MIFSKVCINFSPVLRGGGRRGREGGEGGGKTSPGEDTRWLVAHRWSWPYNQADGTTFRSRVEFQADNTQLVRSTGANVSVMVLQGPKYSTQKSRPLESSHRRHGVCIAIECSYKLDQKNEFKFLCELCTFLQIRSHMPHQLSTTVIYYGPVLKLYAITSVRFNGFFGYFYRIWRIFCQDKLCTFGITMCFHCHVITIWEFLF